MWYTMSQRRSIPCTLGIVPFIWLAVHRRSIPALIVAINGLLFHLFMRNNDIVKNYDILCNIFLILYVNLKVKDHRVVLLTLVGTIGFLHNSTCNTGIEKECMHALQVQVTFFFGLYLSGL